MSLFSGSNISELFVGESKIGSVFVGENCVYQSNYEIPIEEDNGDEYFYFRVHDKRETAQVGFERKTYEYHPSDATTIPTINYSSFPTYVTPAFEYSYDKVTWNPYTLGTLLNIGKGQVANKVYFRGDNLTSWYDEYQQTTTHIDSNNSEVTDTHTFRIHTHVIINNAQVQCNGNIMSLRYKNYQNQLTIPCDYAFAFLFGQCSMLLRSPVLKATTLTEACYAAMFCDCTSLQFCPILPATIMQKGCYATMFYHCTSITTAPVLPATTLAAGCYGRTFLPDSDDSELFGSLLKNQTYKFGLTNNHGMFARCTYLKQAPVLPATILQKGCYLGMFEMCLQLQELPALPATTLAEACYGRMFAYCDATIPPELPATTLADSCYEGMFAYSGITKTPKLSATTLASDCYGAWIGTGMFEGCKHLTSITTLPATTIPDDAYYSMFADSNVKASATQTTECKYAYRVPTSGTGSTASKSLTDMFTDASDTTKKFTPSVNTTFYINVPSF